MFSASSVLGGSRATRGGERLRTLKNSAELRLQPEGPRDSGEAPAGPVPEAAALSTCIPERDSLAKAIREGSAFSSAEIDPREPGLLRLEGRELRVVRLFLFWVFFGGGAGGGRRTEEVV